MKSVVTFILFTLLISPAFAIQEFETIVKDTKFNSSSRVIIDKEEIEKSRAKNLTTLLATQANISIVQSNFTPTTIYLRGGDSGHVLILVDGVPFYDPSTIQRTINLNSLDLKSVQRIEVIKGSQSVLYGGQALTGVIKIDTIPKDLKASGQALGQVGNFSQSNFSAGVLRPITDNTAIVVRGSYSQKDSTSPVLTSAKTYPTSLGTAEIDGIYKGQIDAVLKFQTSFDRTFIPTTAFPAYSAADADNFITTNYQLNGTGIISAHNLMLKPFIALTLQKNNRHFEQNMFDSGGFPTKQDYLGQLTALRFELTPLESRWVNLKVGGSYNQEKMVYNDMDVLKSDETDEFEGIFGKVEFPIHENVLIEVGNRIDFHRMKDAVYTYQAGITLFEIMKLEYATGLKLPSLYQLYSAYGNVGLKPEKSQTYSITIDGNLTPDWFASITGFETKFENLILIRGTPQKYENVSRSVTKGAELSTGYRWLDHGVTVNLAVGYQEPRDLDAGTWLVRRPMRTASFKARKEFAIVSLGTEVVHNGDRRDRMGTTTYGTLNPYTIINLIGEVKPHENLSFFTRVQNISNQRYESSYGFYDEGLSASTGVEVLF